MRGYRGFPGLAFVAFLTLPPAVARGQSFKLLYDCPGGRDGSLPVGNLIYDHGRLYGATSQGGGLNCSGTGCGTTFWVNTATGHEKALHRFNLGAGGAYPMAGIIAVGGKLFGTTEAGGTDSGGTVFAFDLASHTQTVLHRFTGEPDGAYPVAGLISLYGLLYGTTLAGGTTDEGTVFVLDPASGSESVLYSFQADADGAKPEAGLTYGGGTLYGTTSAGGGAGCKSVGGCGTVFAIDPATGGETVLYRFTGAADGGNPQAGLIYHAGKLYGTTVAGGGTACTKGCGTVFRVDPLTGSETVLYDFAGGQDGAYPYSGLTLNSGTLFGTTVSGGGSSCNNCYGTVFGANLASGAEQVLYRFTGGTDGAFPDAGLIAHDGVLYGTTTQGGIGSNGAVFAVTP
jgi:uncharacterized repeat protein (TIGR03803 family)